MARSTRQQRRQRRAQAAGTPPLRPAPRQRPVASEEVEPAAVESSGARPERREESRSGFPVVRFVQEAVAELKKVEWPGQQQVVSGTAVVLVACVIVGLYLYANDQLWRYVVQHVLSI